MSDSTDGVTGAFPAAVWPLNRSEAAIGYIAPDSLGLGTSGCLLPVLPAPESSESPTTRLRWHAASVLPSRHVQRWFVEPWAPVVLRPATRVPGFLKPGQELAYYAMVDQFRKVCSDIDVSHELIAQAFKEAAADNVWDDRAPAKGNAVACCRPALADEQKTDYLDYSVGPDVTATLRHRQDIRAHAGFDKRRVDRELKWSSHREWAVYAGGECSNELWALPLPSAEDNTLREYGVWPQEDTGRSVSDVETGSCMEFTTQIRQILAQELHSGRVCVRTDSMVCTVSLTQSHSGPNWVPQLEACIDGSPYTYDAGDRWTCHASWNPWCSSEYALASGTGCIRLWDCATDRGTVLKAADPSIDYDIQWNSCEYWSCPRQLLCASPTELTVLDARATAVRTTLMSLKESPFAYRGEAFTAICPSALHPLHAVAASTHAIRVFDQRYPKQPIIAWEHGWVPFDPPVYLESTRLSDYTQGSAAGIFAATERSARVYSYIYGQGANDQPYTSLSQHLLRPTTSAANVFETIQVPLAIDPHDTLDYTSGHTYIADYPTGRLAGFSTRLVASRTGTETKRDHVLANGSAVCICLDSFGAVTGHRFVVAPDSDTSNETTSGESACPANLVLWKNAREIDGAILDGASLVFRTKCDSDRIKEEFWAELRKRSETCESVDMTDLYRHLQTSPRTHGSHGFSKQRKALQARLQPLLAKDTSAHELINAVYAVQSPTASEIGRTTLPKQAGDDWSIEGLLLDLIGDATQRTAAKVPLLEVVRRMCPSQGFSTANTAASASAGQSAEVVAHAHAALHDVFASEPIQSSARVQAAIAHAAQDIALSNTRLRWETSAADAAVEFENSAPGLIAPGQDLSDKLGDLSNAARLLDSLWAGSVSDADTQAQLCQPTAAGMSGGRAERTSRRRPQQPLGTDSQATAAPLSLPLSGFASAPTIRSALPLVTDAFTLASSQTLGSSTQPRASQPKKKKARKSGF